MQRNRLPTRATPVPSTPSAGSRHRRHRACAMHVLGTLLIAATLPAHASISTDDLTRLSLEELGDIRITSVSKKAERVADAAASVYVITADDIRRSGARSLPEALRLAPNLHVARASDAGYAISARGMNSQSRKAERLRSRAVLVSTPPWT